MDDLSKSGRPPPFLSEIGDPAAVTRLHEEWRTLQERLRALDHQLRDCAARQRFAASPEHAAKAAEEERSHLEQLDRLMTRARAVEGQLLVRRRYFH